MRIKSDFSEWDCVTDISIIILFCFIVFGGENKQTKIFLRNSNDQKTVASDAVMFQRYNIWCCQQMIIINKAASTLIILLVTLVMFNTEESLI